MVGNNIICIAVVGWDRVWQRQNQVMTKLAAANNVLVIENLELRVRREHFARAKMVRALGKGTDVVKKALRRVRRVDNGIIVFSPFLLPINQSKHLIRLNACILLRSLEKLIHRLEFHDPIFWIYLPSAAAVQLISDVPHRTVVYDCASNFCANPLSSQDFMVSEQEIIRRAGVVFADNRSRCREIANHNPNTFFAPNGVDFSLYEEVRTIETEVPSDISSIPHPIIGYTGALHYWVDFDLLGYLAASRPDWSFVLVGPVDTLADTSPVVERHNVHFLGPKIHNKIPHYIKSFDVSIIPYRIHEFTNYVYPTKLHEYLALGKPVVSTNLAELVPYQNLVKVASTPGEFLRKIEHLLHNKEEHDEDACIDLARQHSWDNIIQQMESKLQ